MKLELAIIENLQREDLNPVDRAKAFKQLTDEFGLKHADVGRKVGKSREYVSNTLRILNLSEEMLNALAAGEIVEGHTRPLLMLTDRPEQQKTLFHEIIAKRLNVRDSEQIARRIALERARKTDLTPELMMMERELSDKLGTRVRIEKGGNPGSGGKVMIEFFSIEDLSNIRRAISNPEAPNLVAKHTTEVGRTRETVFVPIEAAAESLESAQSVVPDELALPSDASPEMLPQAEAHAEISEEPAPLVIAQEPEPEMDPELYSIKNFSV